MTYPPEPWHLEGRLYLSVWLAPRSQTEVRVPPGTRLVTLAGRVPVGTAWVVYEGGGVLRYREVLRAVPVRRGLRPLVTITDIWVDSAASRAGGRELWGIPKDLAVFTVTGGDASTAFSARARSGPVDLGAARFRPLTRLSLRLPVAFHVAQTRAGRLHISPVGCRGRVRPARASWTFGETGPGSGLRRRRPLLSLQYEDFRMLFGRSDRGDRSGRSG